MHSERIKAYSKIFMFIFFKCLLIMTDCCFLFYLTKRENNTSCTINLYKKSRNAGATTFENQYQNTCILRKIKEIDCVVVIINTFNNWYYSIIYHSFVVYNMQTSIIRTRLCVWYLILFYLSISKKSFSNNLMKQLISLCD